MDPFNGATSVRTLWEFVQNVIKLGKIVKCAPEAWRQYSDSLLNVACVSISYPADKLCESTKIVIQLQTAIESTVKTYPQIHNLTIEDNGKQYPLVEYTNNKLHTVKNDASTLLKSYQTLGGKKSTKGRILDFISRRGTAIQFALNEKQISYLIKGVEQAQAHLHLALALVSVWSTESW